MEDRRKDGAGGQERLRKINAYKAAVQALRPYGRHDNSQRDRYKKIQIRGLHGAVLGGFPGFRAVFVQHSGKRRRGYGVRRGTGKRLRDKSGAGRKALTNGERHRYLPLQAI